MNKYNRTKHLNIITLMEEAAFATARLLQEGRIAEVPQLLADSQDTAIALGSHIEKLYGMQTQTVATLEQYCNALYQVSVDMDEASLIALAESIEQILSVYNTEFPEKKEVVFMPYNASMWDSLESVWMAARDDENCEAYVVPIPYYDLGVNRTVKEFRYEGDRFPEYVPITHYEDYDLELRHPDMIFIHNPYDECNLVTSVAPEFYSSRIKDYTDELVYIPYFVLAEIQPENHPAIETMKHFCTLPGVIYADKVIVQSEDMRQIYINEYMKVIEAAGGQISRKELEEKILGLGSPKFDKAVNTKKEDLEIPVEWLRVIEKPDGTWKKIIFYNTSIAAFLENSEQMLQKIEDVLRTFKECQEDVALLWRPHPLMMQTIGSMRPQVRDKYLEIVQIYREEAWGIYDDTSDMDRAVVLSDAYYGDPSSVLWVYEKTQKPIMYQNVYSIEPYIKSLAMSNLVEIEDRYWFVGLKDNCLYCTTKDFQQIEVKERINWDETLPVQTQYGDVVHSRDKIFIIPWTARDIKVYNLITQSMSSIDVKEAYDAREREKLFSSHVIIGNRLYLIPYAYNDIVVVDIDKEVIEKKISLTSRKEGVTRSYLVGDSSNKADRIWVAQEGTSQIGELDIKSDCVKWFDLGNENLCISGIVSCIDGIWIFPKKLTEIYYLDLNSMEMRLYPVNIAGYEPGENSFSKIITCEDAIYVISNEANKIIRLNNEGDISSVIDIKNIDEGREIWLKNEIITNLWLCDNEIFFITLLRGKIYRLYNHKSENITYTFNARDKEQFTFLHQKCIEAENRLDTIETLIKNIVCSNHNPIICIEENYGKEIHKECIKRSGK